MEYIILSVSNFNTGFVAYTSDIVLHLSQWQFWFWFWFNIFWVIFFLFILKIFFTHTLKFFMKINTSLRGHGKWGDFLAGLLPLTWCSGILINSNFILRTIEWQHESALFTLRVHGRQWYWVYKYDLKTLTDKFNVFSVVGSMLKYKSTLSTYNTQKTYKKLLYIINSYTLNNLNTYWKNVQIKDWESTYNNSTYV